MTAVLKYKAERSQAESRCPSLLAVVSEPRSVSQARCAHGCVNTRPVTLVIFSPPPPPPHILPHNRGNVVTFARNTTQIQTAIFSRCRDFLSLISHGQLSLETLRRQRNVMKDTDRRQKREGCWKEEGGGDVSSGENERGTEIIGNGRGQEWSVCAQKKSY